jgi:uncharacterized membrane protein
MDEAPRIEQPVTPPFTGGDDVEKGKGMAWLSYLGILWLVPLLAMKENAFCKFHAKQGILLSILWFASWVVVVIPFIGWLVDAVVWVFIVIMAIMGIVNSLNGKYWKMPILGNWAASWFKF